MKVKLKSGNIVQEGTSLANSRYKNVTADTGIAKQENCTVNLAVGSTRTKKSISLLESVNYDSVGSEPFNDGRLTKPPYQREEIKTKQCQQSNTLHECRYSDVGCEIMGTLVELEIHCKRSPGHHFCLAYECFLKASKELDTVEMKSNHEKENYSKSLREIQELQLKNNELEKKITEMSKETDAKKNSLEQNDSKSLEGIKVLQLKCKELEDQKTELKNRVISLEHQLEMHETEVRFKQLKIKSLQGKNEKLRTTLLTTQNQDAIKEMKALCTDQKEKMLEEATKYHQEWMESSKQESGLGLGTNNNTGEKVADKPSRNWLHGVLQQNQNLHSSLNYTINPQNNTESRKLGLKPKRDELMLIRENSMRKEWVQGLLTDNRRVREELRQKEQDLVQLKRINEKITVDLKSTLLELKNLNDTVMSVE